MTATLEHIINGEITTLSLEAFEGLLPEAVNPLGSYVAIKQTGNLLFTSGALPVKNGKLIEFGAVGSYTLGVEQGQRCARLCAINLCASLKAHLGSLNPIKQIVKLTGFVSSNSSFTQQPQVINGASDLLAMVFGEAGKHARSAVGVSALPINAPVEIELIVEI